MVIAVVSSPVPRILISSLFFLRQAQLLVIVEGNLGLAQLGDAVQIHHGVFGAEDVGESALGQAAVQRHLAALKTAHQARTGTRTLALVAAG